MISTNELYQKLKHVQIGSATCNYSEEKCEELLPLINEINSLKKEKNALILAHSYVSPDIQVGVADFIGDSYELSKKASETDAELILFCAVKFMAETAKIINPQKEVRIPNKLNGCSLADSITADQVRKLKEQHPNFTFVCYINTSAAVKAECDVCVTSSNALKIIKALPNPNIYFLPDQLMGENIANDLKRDGVEKNLLYYSGTCYVHESYEPEMVEFLKLKTPGLEVVSHPECTADIVSVSDFVGSTSQMMNHVKNSSANNFLMLTECGLSSRLQVENPDKSFIGSCTMCKYMKDNSLAGILRALKTPDADDIISLSDDTMQRAATCIEAMFSYA